MVANLNIFNVGLPCMGSEDYMFWFSFLQVRTKVSVYNSNRYLGYLVFRKLINSIAFNNMELIYIKNVILKKNMVK